MKIALGLATAFAVAVALLATLRDAGKHIDCSHVDDIFHDPHFRVSGFKKDLATGCLTEIHGEYVP